MKRFNNKDFLHTIALHLDLFNTIGGGVSKTYARVKKEQESAVIEVWAAGVNPELFKVVLRRNTLTVNSVLTSDHSPNVTVPIFSRTFILPPIVDLNQIEALYQDGKLRIKLPYHEAADRPREIEIKQL
ncbi:Hsp20/alpha crystallin family protein [Pontibacter cellulosilyticus]|uniref:Hsp20 family protein n=1 Tax=Pontibacter cellulosilyticus TaxID=1720253 RepID=A0A923NAV7_9BACT|nr:Hsp20 family protein [Pontibacter cellulosilyticus]MBC5994052.1 Hsp20 family protein [Pontibacter cellulosilyticus]